jgi:HSP20 family protein
MALIRWEPARETRTVASDFERLFNSVFDTSTFGASAGAGSRPVVPALDIVESDDAFTVYADLPGLTAETVNLEIEEGLLTLSGERRRPESAQGTMRLERPVGRFSRSIRLPKGIDPAGVSADFADGVLAIRIPRPAVAAPHRVSIGSPGGESAKAIEAQPES